ncbi:hypothetical protein [Massilia aquatica]|uniref:Uncharacterized protein n=1 Tax=Massilia aquatica TaxID=2609000 RepID=A0ABX0M567_9BURK|nr:hypothetical protein [Massilia aquatica]NHZ42057.1 hypothetical protein [Massilia aquatica]
MISAKNYSDAVPLLDRGIAMVGETYVMQDLSDDTGMKLTLAQIEEKKGAARRAAALQYRVLS